MEELQVSQDALAVDPLERGAQRHVTREQQDAQLVREGHHGREGISTPTREQLRLAFDAFTGEVQGLLGDRRADQGVDLSAQRQLVPRTQGRHRRRACAGLGPARFDAVGPAGGDPGRTGDASAVELLGGELRHVRGTQAGRPDEDQVRPRAQLGVGGRADRDLGADARGVADGQGQARWRANGGLHRGVGGPRFSPGAGRGPLEKGADYAPGMGADTTMGPGGAGICCPRKPLVA